MSARPSDDDLKLARMLLMLGDDDRDLTEEYLRILIDKGLPKTSAKKDVLIIGAGIAGLVAGALLKKAGHRVTILEANANRVGGRIKTFRSGFKDRRQYAEAGAMRIPDFHPLTLALVDKLKLPRRLFYNVDVDPATGITSKTPPVVYRRAWDNQERWRNGRDVKFEPPAKLSRTWIKTNGQQQRRKRYADDPRWINSGFQLGDDARETASTILDRALDFARDYYSYEIDPAAAMPATSDPFIMPLLNSTRKRTRVNKPFAEWRDGWARLIGDFDQFSIRRYLRETAGLTETQLQAIGTIENLTSRMPLSFIHNFIGRAVINPDVRYWEIDGGSWRLPDAFLRDLRKNIVYDARMIELEYYTPDADPSTLHHVSADGPKVWVRTIREPKGGRKTGDKESDERTFTADCAIVTIPFSALRFVSVSPQFSYKKRRAIIELHYDAATKVVLEFSRRWWEFTEDEWRRELGEKEFAAYKAWLAQRDETPLPITGGGSVTDGPNRFAYFPSHPVKGSKGGVILASYAWADDARRWDSIPEENRSKYALKGLKELFGKWIDRYWTGAGRTQSWANDFYAFGEAAVFAPGQLTELHLAIPTPEGNVHFAGEHTSLKHAWIEGAVESGVRATLEISGGSR